MISESILQGESVLLRPVEESDLPKFVEWLADPEVTRWLAAVGDPPTLEDEYEWWESRRADPDNVMWAIDTADGDLIGTVDLRLIPHAMRAELGIAIHDKSQWSKGYGTEAVRLVLEYAFGELGLHRVELHVDEENARAVRCYEKCGFVREGLLREHRIVDGRYVNTIAMAVLREEGGRRREEEGGERLEVRGERLQGTRVRLRPLREEDVAPLTAWFNDPDVRYWLHQSDREDATEADVREVYMRPGDTTMLALAIEVEGGRLIGVTRLIGIDRTHGRAELTIVIGDKSAWGGGYGTEAMRTLLRHAFEEMGLRRVELITDADNARGIRAYEKCGFVREGVLRKHRVRHGKPLDMVVMGVLREEWKEHGTWNKEQGSR